MNISALIANELAIKEEQVIASIQLLDDGSTVPFISRYRKEVTGGLSDTHLRTLEERLIYLRELKSRKETILNSIKEQGKLTDSVHAAIESTLSKSELEDIYLPYKPKRRTKAQIAIEAGLKDLAFDLLTNPGLNPTDHAEKFIAADKGIESSAQALEGARHILMEHFAEQAPLLTSLRDYLSTHANIKSDVIPEKTNDAIKFSDYFSFEEAISKIPSHRSLALFRGQREGFLNLQLALTDTIIEYCKSEIANYFKIESKNRAADAWLLETVNWTWRIKLANKFELELFTTLREKSEVEAIRVFANNLKHLLMAAPAGSHITMGLDPGLRTGVKVVIVDQTGKLLTYTTLFPHAPRNDWDGSIHQLALLCKTHQVSLISIGNGTASRETDKLVQSLMKQHPELKLTSIVVSEAGASVYSASELAAKEFPTLDVSYRGAVSIARRLQDPLAELVKIDPKAIGVGQYQHDVNQTKLSRSLHSVMEDCVNAVGVDINTASIPLLTCISGLNQTIATNIIQYREIHGAFKSREALKAVPRLGEKSFEQCAGFLRIANGNNPLDASAVHPEAYSVVESILKNENKSIHDIMGNTTVISTIKPIQYVNDQFGLPTIVDILKELAKPGRDPRPAFKTASFKEGIETIKDLKPDMILEGVVTNVANFGAFVDIGVHQDGLVHISQITDRYIDDPNKVIKVGDIVKVKVVSIEIERNRISLTMRLNSEVKSSHTSTPQKQPIQSTKKTNANQAVLSNALQDALSKL